MPRKLTTTEFIQRSKEVHSNLYDYSKIEYVNTRTKICIIDPVYGEFWQTPCNHLNGRGCSKRAFHGQKLTTNRFIKKATEVHGVLYDYSNVIYENSITKVCIIDLVYGKFWQTPNDHLGGKGCAERSHNNKKSMHKDHIIPLSILCSYKKRKHNRERPLYKFLDSDINIQEIYGNDNVIKSDWIEYNGKQIRARNQRNNYKVIGQLVDQLLNINIDRIIKEDEEYHGAIR